MRCLYCGKELALLKRLRGGGDFCSDAHKQSYQEEYNRLALSRLLQAQNKGHQAASPAQNAAPPPQASVALEEPVPEDALSTASVQDAAEAPLIEVALAEPLAEPLTEAVPEEAVDFESAEESPSDTVIEEPPLSTEPEPTEAAGFLFESPAVVAMADETPYLEPWLELSPGPAMSEWQTQNGAYSLSSADLLSLDLRPNVSSIEQHALPADLSPHAFPGAQPDAPLSPVAKARKTADANRFPAGSMIVIDIAPRSVEANVDQRLLQAIGLETSVLFDESQLLELSPTAIDFPAEDSSAVLLARNHNNSASLDLATVDHAPSDAEAVAPSADDTPRASLEALSRLHQELVEQESARAPEIVAPEIMEGANPAEPSAESTETPVQVVKAVAVELADTPPETPAAGPDIVEVTAEESKPKFATELFELSIKTFPPAKAALIGGDAFPSNVAPLLPNLKFLPLRPKIALAPGYVPPSQASAPAETKPAAPSAPAVRTQTPSKAPAVGKPAARLTQPKQPSQAAKPAQPATAKAPAPATKTASPQPEATKPPAKPVASTSAQEDKRPNLPEVAPKAAAAEKEQTSKSTPAADQPKPAAEQPKPTADQTKPAANQPKPAGDQPKPVADKPKPLAEKAKPAPDKDKPVVDKAKPAADTASSDNVPNFDMAQPASSFGLGSLKVKLGIAIVLLVVACVYFLGWGGKSSKPASSNPAVSADGSGPSIIMGEGGWVEGWGGDPNGIHVGRQITIYRPSLKLSDYRLEFQGSIDTKSVGWVFRASDPDNYYAMKLMTVSNGLSPKVALFKYLVANGRQTQVGRVPIELAVQQDTVFNIRVDVRGPKFTTFIQGQQVDSWTDDQLKTGGAGFLNEREERGKVKSVSIRYLSGAPK